MGGALGRLAGTGGRQEAPGSRLVSPCGSGLGMRAMWARLIIVGSERSRAMAMVNPPHPGGIVKRECLEPLGLSVTRAAEGLGLSRQALSELVNEKTPVSVEMAIRLSKAFGSSPETWLGMQTAYDLWEIRE